MKFKNLYYEIINHFKKSAKLSKKVVITTVKKSQLKKVVGGIVVNTPSETKKNLLLNSRFF